MKKSKIGKAMELNSLQAATTNLTRIFKPEFGTTIDQKKSAAWDQVYTIEEAKEKIVNANAYSMDGVWISVEVQPDRTQRLAFEAGTLTEDELDLIGLPDLEHLRELIDEIKKAGLEIYGIKIHNVWYRDNWASITPSIFFAKYTSFINDIIDVIGTNTARISVLNEASTIWNDLNATALIITLLQHIKSRGYKAALSGVTATHRIESEDIASEIDFLAYHSYPVISSKRENTTIEDVITAWELSEASEILKYWHTKYPLQELWIVESGILNAWECFRHPSSHLPLKDRTVSENNEVQRIYWEGTFEFFKNMMYLKGICAWYFDYTKDYPLIHDLMKIYRGVEI